MYKSEVAFFNDGFFDEVFEGVSFSEHVEHGLAVWDEHFVDVLVVAFDVVHLDIEDSWDKNTESELKIEFRKRSFEFFKF